MNKQINQSQLFNEITKHQIIVGLLTIVDEIKHDSQVSDDDIVESIMELILKNDLISRSDIEQIWKDCP